MAAVIFRTLPVFPLGQLERQPSSRAQTSGRGPAGARGGTTGAGSSRRTAQGRVV